MKSLYNNCKKTCQSEQFSTLFHMLEMIGSVC